MIPVIFGIKGLKLLEEEKNFFSKMKPAGYIIFSRNIESRSQIQNLVSDFKAISGNDISILIDQEGGRVARLKPPLFMECPSAQYFIDKATQIGIENALEECYNNYKDITKNLLELGINFNCAPVADLYHPAADKIIGDRSFGSDIEINTKFCHKVMNAISEAGGNYIIKHIPGHGRANLDSHFELPVITETLEELENTDFKIFKNLVSVGADYAMTAHIIYEALDRENPATMSKTVINYIRHNIGFRGKLITDDISMKALTGDLGDIAVKSLEAGCDIVLHCNGNMDEMQIIGDAAAKPIQIKI